MEFRVLGPVEVSSGGRPLRLGGPQQRALLAFLLLHANEVVSADRLLDELWAVPPAGGVAAVRTQVSRLRKLLGVTVETSGRGYLLRIERGELDLDRFRSLLAEAGGTSDPSERSALLREADRLWRGEALSGLDAPFAAAEAAALEELRLAALEDRLEADLERGLDGQLISELSALVARYPLRERLRGQLILALYRAGRQADALEAYRDTRRILYEQLGLEPSPALRELEQAILRHDPALAPMTPAVVAANQAQPRRRRLGLRALAGVALAAIGAVGAAVALLGLGDHSNRPIGAVAAGPSTQEASQPHSTAARPARPIVRRRAGARAAASPAAATAHPVITHPTRTIGKTASVAPAKPSGTSVRTTIAKPPPKLITVSDRFDRDYVDPTIWHEVKDGGDVSIVEQGGQLQLTVGADAVPGGAYDQIDVHVGTQCSFPGNFDARVDYALLEWPARDNIDVGLNAIFATGAVMRDNSSQWGDEYSSWVTPGNGSAALPDARGSLRIARVNGVETTYFWHQGGWRRLASSPAAGAAVLGLQAFSDGHNPFGGQELKVAFDNFKVSGVEPACRPGSYRSTP